MQLVSVVLGHVIPNCPLEDMTTATCYLRKVTSGDYVSGVLQLSLVVNLVNPNGTDVEDCSKSHNMYVEAIGISYDNVDPINLTSVFCSTACICRAKRASTDQGLVRRAV